MSDSADERTAVRTYVPRYQKEAWAEQAEAMDMSLSEFVRSMVQSGRRGFGGDDSAGGPGDDESSVETADEQPRSEGSNPGGRDLETVVLDCLREEPHAFDELVEHVLADVRESMEDDVGDALQSLQADNRVTHDPREGAYTLMDDE